MKFTVVIPVLNEEKYIYNMLTSLENQTLKNFNVIIVNNGCTDNTIKIIRKFIKQSDLKIILVYCKQRGISYARNFGAQLVRSKYIIFFDADTKVEQSWMKKADEYIRKHPKLIALGGLEFFKSEKGILSTIHYNLHCFITFPIIYLIQIIYGNAVYICGNNMLIERQAFLKAGQFPHIVAEDIGLTLNLLKTFKGRGKILFKPNLIVTFSTRKFEKMGYLKTLWGQIKGFKHKINSKDYKIAREK